MSTIALIASMSKNRVIGDHNQIPWHLPADLHYFKKMTMGKPMIMGRQTYDSIGKPLPGRTSIVVTRNIDWQAPTGVHVVHSIDQGIDLATTLTEDEIMIIGGGTLYKATLPLADTLYITYIDIDVAGDTQFPGWNHDQWQENSRELHEKDQKNPYDYTFCVYTRL